MADVKTWVKCLYLGGYLDCSPVENIKERIGRNCDGGKDAYKKFDDMPGVKNIKQDGTVKEYHDVFTSYYNPKISWTKKTNLGERCLIDLFMRGLQPEIEEGVRRFQTKTLYETYLWAQLQEVRDFEKKKNTNSHIPMYFSSTGSLGYGNPGYGYGTRGNGMGGYNGYGSYGGGNLGYEALNGAPYGNPWGASGSGGPQAAAPMGQSPSGAAGYGNQSYGYNSNEVEKENSELVDYVECCIESVKDEDIEKKTERMGLSNLIPNGAEIFDGASGCEMNKSNARSLVDEHETHIIEVDKKSGIVSDYVGDSDHTSISVDEIEKPSEESEVRVATDGVTTTDEVRTSPDPAKNTETCENPTKKDESKVSVDVSESIVGVISVDESEPSDSHTEEVDSATIVMEPKEIIVEPMLPKEGDKVNRITPLRFDRMFAGFDVKKDEMFVEDCDIELSYLVGGMTHNIRGNNQRTIHGDMGRSEEKSVKKNGNEGVAMEFIVGEIIKEGFEDGSEDGYMTRSNSFSTQCVEGGIGAVQFDTCKWPKRTKKCVTVDSWKWPARKKMSDTQCNVKLRKLEFDMWKWPRRKKGRRLTYSSDVTNCDKVVLVGEYGISSCEHAKKYYQIAVDCGIKRGSRTDQVAVIYVSPLLVGCQHKSSAVQYGFGLYKICYMESWGKLDGLEPLESLANEFAEEI